MGSSLTDIRRLKDITARHVVVSYPGKLMVPGELCNESHPSSDYTSVQALAEGCSQEAS